MPIQPSKIRTIATASLCTKAQDVITAVLTDTPWADLLHAKLGQDGNEPMTNQAFAALHAIPVNTVRKRLPRITRALSETDSRYGNPLAKIARRANATMARAAIVNRHHRRPPLYSETTLRTFVKMGAATAQSIPFIRAAGYVAPPPAAPLSHTSTKAIRVAASAASEVSWQGLATYGLREWETALSPQNFATPRRRTGDLIYAFLTNNGPARLDDIIEHVQRNSPAKKSTVQEAVNHDPAHRFIRIHDGRVAANPFPQGLHSDVFDLTVVPDGQRHQPALILHESELRWLTRYLQHLNELAPPWPVQVALTGPRAVGLAQESNVDLTVVVDHHDQPSLEPRLAAIAAAASQVAPSVRPNISIATPQDWDCQQGRETVLAHHDLWLAPRATP